MKQEYRYPFNEAIFREQMQLLLRMSQKKESERTGSYLVFVALCLISGVGLLYFDSNRTGAIVGSIFLLGGFIYLAGFINYLVKKKKVQILFNQKLNEEVERFQATDGFITIGLSDEDFYYHDSDHEMRVKWNLIKSRIEIDGHLFLVMDNDSLSGYVISAFDISTSDFNEITRFLETKVKSHYLSQKKEEHPENTDVLDN